MNQQRVAARLRVEMFLWSASAALFAACAALAILAWSLDKGWWNLVLIPLNALAALAYAAMAMESRRRFSELPRAIRRKCLTHPKGSPT